MVYKMIFAAMLAGGIGSRMGLDKPKQFEKVGDKPIIIHSTNTFLKVTEINKIIISSPQEYIKETKELINMYFPNNSKKVYNLFQTHFLY